MRSRNAVAVKKSTVVALVFWLVLITGFLAAQDRLKLMPGTERFQKMSQEIKEAVKLGSLTVKWADDGKSFEYPWDGKLFKYDIAKKKATEIGPAPAEQERRRRAGGPERGRQYTEAISPDKKLKAFTRDRNFWLSDADGKNELAVTTDGNVKDRIKYGTASWVYGEEMNQTTAMWWSPDSKKIAYYRVDESRVPDYFLQMDQTKLYDTLDIEAYPKAGEPNPVVDIFIYDLATKKTVKADVRDGQPFDNSVLGHYVYRVSWSPDGKELLFNRTNRRQNIMEFTACNPETGKCRVIVREEWLPSWTDNSPPILYLKDNKRFIWESERTGWKNYYLYDLSGKLLVTLTNHPFEVAGFVHADEKAGFLYYMARSGDNHMKLQLHRVGLNGKGDKRLTDPAFNHTVNMAPNGKYYIDVAQTHDIPPMTSLRAASGKLVAELAKSDMTKFDQLGLKKVERIRYKTANGVTELYGMLNFPSNFDPNKKYPLLVSVYAGPESNGARETFATPNPLTEYGFLVASLDSRGASGRGKKALDTVYMRLGLIEMDDQAAGVKSLWDRPYLDKSRVGIYGSSYGGYSSVMCLFRHPDVFQAASASSSVTAWYNYDSIYTERYMWIPQENKEGYEAGDAMKYVDNLKGRLMLFYGTADNNVHPNNTMQLIQALQKAGKSFDVQVGPDKGHSAISQDRMMEFFIENLVLK